MSGSERRDFSRRHRFSLVLIGAVLALVLLLAPAAASGFGGLDRSFGKNGIVDLTYNPTPQSGNSLQVGAAPDGKLIVLGVVWPGCGGCLPGYYLIRFHPDGRRDWSYGGDGTVSLPEVQVQSGRYQLLVDGRGRQIVGITDELGERVHRFTRNGFVDRSFVAAARSPFPAAARRPSKRSSCASAAQTTSWRSPAGGSSLRTSRSSGKR